MSTITDAQRQELEKQLGADFAKMVIERADAVGKELEAQDVAFKSAPDGFSAETLIVLGAIKALTEKDAAYVKELDEHRQTVKDLSNQVAQLITKFDGDKDVSHRTQEALAGVQKALSELTARRPAASKSPNTQIADDDPQARFLDEKNNEADEKQKAVPVLSQIMGRGIPIGGS